MQEIKPLSTEVLSIFDLLLQGESERDVALFAGCSKSKVHNIWSKVYKNACTLIDRYKAVDDKYWMHRVANHMRMPVYMVNSIISVRENGGKRW